jgi:branched-chain amino acid transport system substrate-binding protein
MPCISLPGGMGVNFVKQYAAAGMDPKIVRVMPAYDADQQMLSNGDLIAGVANTGQWSADLPNEQNRPSWAAYAGANTATSRRCSLPGV